VDQEAEYPVMPEGNNPTHYEVYSIEKVTGKSKGTAEDIHFAPAFLYDISTYANAVYRERCSASLVRQGLDTYVAVKLPRNVKPGQIAELSVDLLCTNGTLAERLDRGDVHKDTDNSPRFASFLNSKPVTPTLFDSLGDNRLWRLYGMQFINLKLLTAESLRAVLKLINVSVGQNWQTAERNEGHIEGIQGLTIEACDRIVRQVMKRGWNIRIVLESECYCSPGDMYLFGSMLDHFLRGFVSEAYFSRIIIEDIRSGQVYEMPTKMGRKPLV